MVRDPETRFTSRRGLAVEILDKYQLEQPLGEGGTARVWRALDTSLQRPVAVKVMKLATDELDRERFRDEARALSKLHSRHLLEVLDFGEVNGSFYFVMPFVPVVCLADLGELRRLDRRAFTVAETAVIGIQVARALQEAHRHKILHRDVKPQNILVGPSAAVYLTDFGIARDLESEVGHTQAGTLVGTPRYMAPEQIRGGTAEFSTDLYALGLVLFELVSGRLPREMPQDLAATLRARLEGVGEPLAAACPGAAALGEIVDGLLLSPPDRKPRTASALAEGLEPLVGRGDALASLQSDVDRMLGRVSDAEDTGRSSPWTVLGREASQILSGPAGSSASEPAPRRQAVPPLSKQSLASERMPEGPGAAWRRRRRVAIGAVLLASSVAALLAVFGRHGSVRPSVNAVHVTPGFRRLRLNWSGEAKELSLVTPRGQEELYEVRGREDWESGTLLEPGSYAVSLVPVTGEPVMLAPLEYRPFEPQAASLDVERELDGVRVGVSLPMEFTVEATLRGEDNSVHRADSVSPARHQSVRLKLDPAEGGTLRLTYKSRLGEEASSPPREIVGLVAALQKASQAITDRDNSFQWKGFYAHLLQKYGEGQHLSPGAQRDVAALALDKPLEGLLPAVGGFLDSERFALDQRNLVYQAIMRASRPEFYCERYGLPLVSDAWKSLPASWVSTAVSRVTSAEEHVLPFDGIMTFKPRLHPMLASYDLLDEISRVSKKETRIELANVGSIRRAEVMLETWALKPDQWFSVRINDRTELEFHVRWQEFQERQVRKQTLPLYHELNPRALVEGANRFVIVIHAVPSGEVPDSAAINRAVLRLGRGLPSDRALGAIFGRGEDLVQPSETQGR